MFNSFSVYFKVLSDFSVDLYFKEELGRQFNEMHHFQRVNYARSPRFKFFFIITKKVLCKSNFEEDNYLNASRELSRCIFVVVPSETK